MAGLTDEQRLEKIEQRQKQLKAQERKIKARLSAKERKRRTHELIQFGAILTSALDLQLDEHTRTQLTHALNHHYEDGSTLKDHLRAQLHNQLNQPPQNDS